MKIIHTADWHLGATIYDYDRLNEHKAFLDNLLKHISSDQEINALLLSGDVFHNNNPSNEAERLFSEFLVRVKKERPNFQVFIISGNHDGLKKLDTAGGYCSLVKGINIVGSIPYVENSDNIDYRKMVFPLYDNAGKIEGIVVAIPFLKNSYLKGNTLFSDNVASHTTEESLSKLYENSIKYARENISETAPIIAMGHMAVVGTVPHATIDENRPLVIGGEETVNSAIFKDCAYAALGHIHLKQSFGNVTFSGSPIPINVGEARYKNGYYELELSNGQITKNFIEVPRTVDIVRIPQNGGAIDYKEIAPILKNFTYQETEDLEKRPFLMIFIALNHEIDSQEKVAMQNNLKENLVNHKIWRLCNITFVKEENGATYEELESCDLSNLKPLDIFKRCYRENIKTENDNDEPPSYLIDAFNELLEEYKELEEDK